MRIFSRFSLAEAGRVVWRHRVLSALLLVACVFSVEFYALKPPQANAAYTISNSARFVSGSSTYLSRTPSSPGDQQKFTWSGWVKRSTLSLTQVMFDGYKDTSNRSFISFSSTDAFEYKTVIGGSTVSDKVSTALFRDPAAWIHIIVAVDTTQATAANRERIYVNGSEITSFSTNIDHPQNGNMWMSTTTASQDVGRQGASNAYFDGYMSDVYFVDGQALTPTSFGEYDSNGYWRPKSYAGSYGTNGFKLAFGNSAALGTDTSGNGNTFTSSGLATTDQMTDTPTNSFATGNPISPGGSPTYTQGNLVSSGAATSTFFMSTGKWYWEVAANASGVSAGVMTAAGVPNTASVSSGGTIGFFFDADAGTLASTTDGITLNSTVSGLIGGRFAFATGGSNTFIYGAGGTTTLTYYSTAGGYFRYNPEASLTNASTTFLTSGTSWTVPSDWTSASNTIEVIGGGGGGSGPYTGVSGGGGGGGGGYSKASNTSLTSGVSVAFAIGSGGTGGNANGPGTAGGNTYFCNSSSNCASLAGTAVVAGASGGAGGTSTGGGAGGASSSGVGSTKNSGGAGGWATSIAGHGGGGAGGPNGTGGAGGTADNTGGHGGGGGGGNGGGSAGSNATTVNGANGGNGYLGSGAGVGGAGTGGDGTSGTGGGGAGGAGAASGDAFAGGSGAVGGEWDSTHGSGGGGGGAGTPSSGGSLPGGSGGTYGGGGGGGGRATFPDPGGSGAQGIVVIKYGGTSETSFSGYKALSTNNLPEPAVVVPKQYFDAATYTGTGEARSVGGSTAATTTTYLLAGTTWTVPSDWNSSNNTIEVIGGGGSGADTSGASRGAGGGGGGAYSKATNISLSPGATSTYAVGSGGARSTTNGTAGGDTYFCVSTSNCANISGTAVAVGAKGGSGNTGQTGGSGGASASGVGTTKYSGGNGGSTSAATYGGGGGGAAGPNGAGGSVSTDIQAGGQGGNGFGGAGSASGSSGGGSAGTEWDSTHGSGGGTGGGNFGDNVNGSGGKYGGGGGGAGANSQAGGAGRQGIIVIKYVPAYSTLQPNLVWIKNRTSATNHALFDSVRGVQNWLSSNLTNAEVASSTTLTSFDTNGFSVGTSRDLNKSGDNYISWLWKESPTAGFDIVTYTGNGSNRTISHALSSPPEMIFVKDRSGANDWAVYHALNTAAPETDYLLLNSTASTADDSTYWNDIAPFSTGDTLLLHGDGTDGSTTFTDSSDSAHAVTPSGEAQIDTAQSKFGGASMLFDGSGDYLTVAGRSAFAFATADFTIDFWYRANSFTQYDTLIGSWSTGSNTGDWRIYQLGTGEHIWDTYDEGTCSGYLSFGTLSTGTWYHMAVTRSSGTVRIFLDGVQQGSDQSDSCDLDGTYELHIGANFVLSLSSIDAHIDDLRISNSVARWTSNFTPPTSAHTPSTGGGAFSIGTNVDVNTNTNTYIAYLFDEIPGFSKFGTYTGNASTDGPFVYTGFKPAYLLVKRTDTTQNWNLYSTAVDPFNPTGGALQPNLSDAEWRPSPSTNANVDLNSNGFKLRNTDINVSAATYIYAAFAEQPFKYSAASAATAASSFVQAVAFLMGMTF